MGGSYFLMLLIIIMMFVMMFSSQKKQQKKLDDMRNAMEPGDTIMTTGGFYGTLLDIVDDNTVIVEFGNDRHCRIPMHKNAIAEVEKAGSAIISDEENSDSAAEETEEKKSKGIFGKEKK